MDFLIFKNRQRAPLDVAPALALERDNRDRHRDSSSTWIIATGTKTRPQRGSSFCWYYFVMC
jgi:hypothetical protein